jgi:molybdenum cofactor cytidylyltransferase
MGQSKLLLSWRGTGDANSTLLDHVLEAWTASGVRRTIIVIRTDADAAVKQICQSRGIDIVMADDPIDMKASCLLGLKHLSLHYSPSLHDRFFVCPADIPGITSDLIDHLISEAERHDVMREPDPADRVFVPTHQGRRGHPVLFPWSMASQMELLGADQGINCLVDRAATVDVEFSVSPEQMADIDTPEQYAAAARLFAENNESMPSCSSNSDPASRSDPPQALSSD